MSSQEVRTLHGRTGKAGVAPNYLVIELQRPPRGTKENIHKTNF